MRRRYRFAVAASASLATLSVAFLPGCGSDITGPVKTSTAPKTTQTSNVVTSEEKPADEDAAFKQRLDDAIAAAGKRKLKFGEGEGNAAWQVVHGILPFGPALMLDYNGTDVPALDYLLSGGQLTGWNLRPAEKGVTVLVESGTKTGQGHKDQWIGYLSACDIDANHPVKVGDKEYKFIDLITQAQWECRVGEEHGWTLSGLLPFIPLDAKWQSSDGEEWSYERLIEEEAKANLDGASCGGTHSLIGVANVLNAYVKNGGKLEGGWQIANDRVQFCVQKAKEHQQQDGSFSTGFFVKSATLPKIDGVMHATGHTLEFLSWSLTDEQLREPWVRRAVDHLLGQLEVTREVPVECGALYHAARGLQLYRGRMFGFPGAETTPPTSESASVGHGAK